MTRYQLTERDATLFEVARLDDEAQVPDWRVLDITELEVVELREAEDRYRRWQERLEEMGRNVEHRRRQRIPIHPFEASEDGRCAARFPEAGRCALPEHERCHPRPQPVDQDWPAVVTPDLPPFAHTRSADGRYPI